MATLPPDPADPLSSLVPDPKPGLKPVVLPPEMEGWLSTQQVAETMGMGKRRFQDLD